MKRAIKIVGITALLGAGIALGGCVYDPAYYRHSDVVYSSGNAAVDYGDDYYYSSPGYYYPAYYGSYPYYGGWGWPYVSLGFYGSYYGGYHHGYRGSYHPRAWSGGHTAPPTHHHH